MSVIRWVCTYVTILLCFVIVFNETHICTINIFTFICKKAKIVCSFLSEYKCIILYKTYNWNIFFILKTCYVCSTLRTSFIAHLLWKWFCFSLLFFLVFLWFCFSSISYTDVCNVLAINVQSYLMPNKTYVNIYVMLW